MKRNTEKFWWLNMRQDLSFQKVTQAWGTLYRLKNDYSKILKPIELLTPMKELYYSLCYLQENEMVELLNFYNANRNENKSIANYILRLRPLVKSSAFLRDFSMIK